MLVAVNMTLRLIARYIAVRFFVCRSSEESGRMGLYVHTAEVRNMIRADNFFIVHYLSEISICS